MSHPNIVECMEFARGMLSGPRRTLMEEHLSSGCAECFSIVDSFRRVAGAARQEASYTPPAGLVERAIAIAGAVRLPNAKEGSDTPPRPWIAAVLVYNSQWDLQPAGARAIPADTLQLLYRSGEFLIDLRLEPRQDSSQVNLTGQIVDQNQPDVPVAGLAVELVAGKVPLAATVCNEFGEFTLDYQSKQNRRLRLRIATPDTLIELGLDPERTG